MNSCSLPNAQLPKQVKTRAIVATNIAAGGGRMAALADAGGDGAMPALV